MKRLAGVLVLAVSMLFMAVPAMADDDGVDGISEYVHASKSPGNGPRLDIAPGLYGHIAARADAFLANGNGNRTIFALDLLTRMVSGERFFLVDVRAKVDYDKAHVPGAVSVPFADLAKPANLALLPKDGTPIVTICYTGHTASQSNAILNLLGYNAWSLRFGMTGWVKQTTTRVWNSKVSQIVYGANYATEATQ